MMDQPVSPLDRAITWLGATLIVALRSRLVQRLPKKAAAPLPPPYTARHRLNPAWVATQPLYRFAALTAHQPILISDDERVLLDLYQLLFERHGLTVITTTTGYDAFEISQTRRVSMLMTDLMKPDMSGFELIERVRSRARTRCLPVLIVSARSLSIDDHRALGDWTWYLSKPFAPDELVERVRLCLELREQS